MTTYCYLIPMYNEADNLKLLHNRITTHPLEGNSFYVFVDDCSTDDSIAIVKKLFSNQQCHVIEKETNKGPGDSFNKGMEYILDKFSSDRDVKVITMEADNTSDIEILKEMVGISHLGYDLVLASIYAQGGGFSQTTFLRKLLSFVANMVFRAVFNIKILTLSSFYRIYDIELLRKIKAKNTQLIEEHGFICMLEILIKAIEQDAKCIEVPMLLDSQIRQGKSKMKIWSNSIKYIQFLLKYMTR